jgi:deoxyribonuclease-1
MEADLHNLYPTRAGTNGARSNMTFGDVPGEAREFGNKCDFEIDTMNRVVEPPPGARGNVARSIFYMHREYGLPIELTLLLVLKAWNLSDPSDGEERRRNDVIEGLQGTRNPFIDLPGLGNQL